MITQSGLNKSERLESDAKLVELEHGLTHYKTHGSPSNQSIVLVHGLSSPLFIWDYQIDPLVDMGYHVIRYDLYGRGYSDRPDVKYTPKLFRTQLKQFLNEMNINNPVPLVGHSMGGAISTDFTHQYPNRVDELCLIAPAGIREEMPWWYHLLTAPGITESILYTGGDFYFTNIESLGLSLGKESWWNVREKMKQQVEFDGFKDAMLSTLRHGPIYGLRDAYENLGETDLNVNVIWSSNDKVVPYELHDTLTDVVPQAEVHLIHEGRHPIQYVSPEPFNETLKSVL